MSACTVSAVTIAPRRAVSLPEARLAVLPAWTRLLVWMTSLPSALPLALLALAVMPKLKTPWPAPMPMPMQVSIRAGHSEQSEAHLHEG